MAVYCGSSKGARPEYMAAARALGEELVKREIKLIYGGGTVGLMGEIARTVAAGSGEHNVIGVIPAKLQPREVSGEGIGDVRVVDDIHVRKAMMSEEADAFIALPGGFGTLEELLEMVTWQQLGFHGKPVGVLNICGFYDQLLKFADHMVEEGFVRPNSRTILQCENTPAELLDALQAYTPPTSLVELLAAEARGKP